MAAQWKGTQKRFKRDVYTGLIVFEDMVLQKGAFKGSIEVWRGVEWEAWEVHE